MSILCLLFGHKARENDYSGGEYMRVRLGALDGIGRQHATLLAICPRCEVEYRAGQIHVPKLKAKPMNQPTKPDDLIDQIDRLVHNADEARSDGEIVQALRARLADRASHPPVAGSVDTPEYRKLLGEVMESSVCGYTHSEAGEERWIAANSALIAHINALIAPAAPSGEAVAWAFPDGLERLERVRNGYVDSSLLVVNAAPTDGYTVPLYTHPAPRDVDAPIVLPEKPEPTINGTVYHEEHKICYTAPVHYTAVQMDEHATAAVQNDRTNWKETK